MGSHLLQPFEQSPHHGQLARTTLLWLAREVPRGGRHPPERGGGELHRGHLHQHLAVQRFHPRRARHLRACRVIRGTVNLGSKAITLNMFGFVWYEPDGKGLGHTGRQKPLRERGMPCTNLVASTNLVSFNLKDR